MRAEGTAGPLDRLLMAWQRLAGSVTSRVPRGLWLAAVAGLAAWGTFRLLQVVFPADAFWIYAAFVIGVLEILVFARTRTVSAGTVLRAGTAGASLVSMALIATVSLYGAIVGVDATLDLVSSALVTPLAEEAFKVLPVLLILAASHRARSLTIVDIGLLGFVSGLGFSVTEEVMRASWGAGDLPASGGLGGAPRLYDSMTVSGFPAEPLNTTIAWNERVWESPFWSHSLAAFLVAVSIGFAWHAIRARKRMLMPVLVLPVAAYVYVVSLHGYGNSQGGGWGTLAESASYLASVDWVFERLGQVDLLRPLAFSAFVLALAVDFFTLYRSDSRVTRYVLPAIDLSGPRPTMRAWRRRRVQRLAVAARTYGDVGAPLDVWSQASLSRARIASIVILGVGVVALANPSATGELAACATCNFNWTGALPAWLLALLGLLGADGAWKTVSKDSTDTKDSKEVSKNRKHRRKDGKDTKHGTDTKDTKDSFYVPSDDVGGVTGTDFDTAPKKASDVTYDDEGNTIGWSVKHDQGHMLVSDTTGDGQPDRGWIDPAGGGDRQYWQKGSDGTWKQVSEDSFYGLDDS